MDLEITTEEARQRKTNMTYMWKLKNKQMNLFTKQRLSDTENIWLPKGKATSLMAQVVKNLPAMQET